MGRRSNYREVAVGTTSGVLLPTDPYRHAFTISNDSNNTLYIAFQGQTASTTSIAIKNTGGQYIFDRSVLGDAVAGQVNAIYATAGATVGVLVGLVYHDTTDPEDL